MTDKLVLPGEINIYSGYPLKTMIETDRITYATYKQIRTTTMSIHKGYNETAKSKSYTHRKEYFMNNTEMSQNK